jgi:hypothetical protein
MRSILRALCICTVALPAFAADKNSEAPPNGKPPARNTEERPFGGPPPGREFDPLGAQCRSKKVVCKLAKRELIGAACTCPDSGNDKGKVVK